MSQLSTERPAVGQTWRPFNTHRPELDIIREDTAHGWMVCLKADTKSETFMRPRTLRRRYRLVKAAPAATRRKA